MNQINDRPNTYEAGLEFNYAAWTPDTVITLTNVPWNNDYRDIVNFETTAALNAYIDKRETTNARVGQVSYTPVNRPVSLDLPFNAVYKYNYLRASNPLQPITGDIQRDYYYFITDVRYVAPMTTQIIVQLDVWQTFGREITFGNCYIERGHIGIANENAFNNYGRDYLTIPEGLDVGSEYRLIDKRDVEVMGASNSVRYSVLVASTTDLEADAGNVNNPVLVSAPGSEFQGMPSGASYYIWADGAVFKSFMNNMKEKPWVTQGIISITAIPKLTRYGYGPTPGTGVPTQAPPNAPQTVKDSLWDHWRDDVLQYHIPARYKRLKKLLTYPYLIVELTTFTGTPIILKPEAWGDEDGTYTERASLLPPNQRIMFSPYKYNANPYIGTTGAYGQRDDGGEYLDLFTQVTNFPTMALVNNGAINYMASNAHSIAFQNQAADWSQQRAMRGNEVSYDQATSGMNLANELTGIGRSADAAQTALGNQTAWQQTGVNAIGGVLGGVASGGRGGGAAGAAVGAASGLGSAAMAVVGTAIQTGANNASLAIRNSQANRSNAAQVGNSGYIRDTNKNLADWAARGDYETQIAGINAKVQDARLTQPSTSGQVGGESLVFINDGIKLSMRVKAIDPSAMRVVGEYWLRYGYAVRQFAKLPKSLHVMSKFTYWKLTETYIQAGAMPETFKQAIRGIFEKGVTVWRDADEIGMIDIADNAPLTGVRL